MIIPPLPFLKFWRELLIAGLAVAVCVQQTRVASEQASHQKTKAANAVVLRDLADKTLKAYQAVVADDQARKVKNAKLDAKHTKELQDEKDKLEKLRDDVRTGRVGLRVNATCKSPARADMPAPTEPARVADAEGARLTDAAERDYFTLRAGIETSRKQVEGLQEYVREVCLK